MIQDSSPERIHYVIQIKAGPAGHEGGQDNVAKIVSLNTIVFVLMFQEQKVVVDNVKIFDNLHGVCDGLIESG